MKAPDQWINASALDGLTLAMYGAGMPGLSEPFDAVTHERALVCRLADGRSV